MSVTFVTHGHVGSRVVMVFELGNLRGTRRGHEFEFMSAVTNHQIRHYELDAHGELALRFVMGLGYAEEYLREVIVYVTKVHKDVLNAHVGDGEDTIESMVLVTRGGGGGGGGEVDVVRRGKARDLY
ncbi:hypothetical protein CBR_g36527 [Chara braunii]|uniref:Uncharacterized protein n=1 Tax=Chara braunii TaxID=69332 RepID=A0A388LKZ7_CHABU|nr:hypothetical protein CBR_g36527 [Chara braunii]|eukprot:GBG82998.1 hypothetical protein CBR_g36527 [Chara braunii]